MRRKFSGLHQILDDNNSDDNRLDSSGGYYDDVVKPWNEVIEKNRVDFSPSPMVEGDAEFLSGHFTKGWLPVGGHLYHP